MSPIPQRDARPGPAVAALRWSPKPSAAAVVAIGVAAAAQRALRGPASQSEKTRAADRSDRCRHSVAAGACAVVMAAPPAHVVEAERGHVVGRAAAICGCHRLPSAPLLWTSAVDDE
jgi:hypothetical protein